MSEQEQEPKVVIIDKVQRQNAAALVRQDYQPVKAILAAAAKGSDLTKYEQDEALCRALNIRGTCIEAVIEYCRQWQAIAELVKGGQKQAKTLIAAHEKGTELGKLLASLGQEALDELLEDMEAAGGNPSVLVDFIRQNHPAKEAKAEEAEAAAEPAKKTQGGT